MDLDFYILLNFTSTLDNDMIHFWQRTVSQNTLRITYTQLYRKQGDPHKVFYFDIYMCMTFYFLKYVMKIDILSNNVPDPVIM